MALLPAHDPEKERDHPDREQSQDGIVEPRHHGGTLSARESGCQSDSGTTCALLSRTRDRRRAIAGADRAFGDRQGILARHAGLAARHADDRQDRPLEPSCSDESLAASAKRKSPSTRRWGVAMEDMGPPTLPISGPGGRAAAGSWRGDDPGRSRPGCRRKNVCERDTAGCTRVRMRTATLEIQAQR